MVHKSSCSPDSTHVMSNWHLFTSWSCRGNKHPNFMQSRNFCVLCYVLFPLAKYPIRCLVSFQAWYKKSHSPDPTKHIPFSVLHLWKLSREKNANPCKIQVSAVCFGQVLFPRAKFLFRYIICYIVFRVLWGVRFRGTKKATVQTQPKNVQMAHIYFSEVVEETWDMQI
jgi:hypothetical protein